jgi:YbgC/YbaW family acyl-CoA thioester hydrolase
LIEKQHGAAGQNVTATKHGFPGPGVLWRVGLSETKRANMSPFKTKRTVLFGDCDPAGAIYMPRVAHFVVEAVLEFQSSVLAGPAARKLFEMGIYPPARNLAIDFLAPLTWDDELELEVTCTAVGTTSFTCEVLAKRSDLAVAFKGRLTQVCVSPETKKPVPLPDKLRQALSKTT